MQAHFFSCLRGWWGIGLFLVAAAGTADLYVANGASGGGTPSVTVYALAAQGNAAPARMIAGSNTNFNTPQGVFVDLVNNELYVADFFGEAIRVFPLGASGNAAPIRTLVNGPNSGLSQARDMIVDTVHNELIMVSILDSIRVYPRTANGDVAPIRVINGATTKLNNPISIAFDPGADELFVDSYDVGGVNVPGILVFNRTDSGNVAAKRAITGSNTQLGTFTNFVTLDIPNGELFAQGDGGSGIVVFNLTDNGNVAPKRNLTGSSTGIVSMGGIVVDDANGRVITDLQQGPGNVSAVLVFSRTATGNTKPLMSLFGSATQLVAPFGLALDSAGGLTGTSSDTTTPVAIGQSLFVSKNGFVNFTLAASDPDNTTFLFNATSPSNGSISYDANTGAGTYTPSTGLSGADSFTFTAFDGVNTSAPATVSITISDSTAAVPTLDPRGLAALALLLALAGFVAARQRMP